MISNKFNLIFGAAIFASTVYFLWVKIKRKSVSNDKGNEFTNDKNSKLLSQIPEKHIVKKSELKDHEYDTKNLENKHARIEKISKTLDKDVFIEKLGLTNSSEDNLAITDDIRDESLSENLNKPSLMLVNIGGEDKNKDSVILNNFINKNILPEHQYCYSESVAENNFQLIEQCINDENNDAQCISNEAIKNTLKFENKNEMKNAGIDFSLFNVKVESEIKTDSNIVDIESNKQALVEKKTVELVQNVFYEIVESNKCKNEIFSDKLCPTNILKSSLNVESSFYTTNKANTEKLSFLDEIGNSVKIKNLFSNGTENAIPTEAGYLFNNLSIKNEEYSKQVAVGGDTNSSVSFAKENESLQIYEKESSLNQMHIGTHLSFLGAYIENNRNQCVLDEIEIIHLAEPEYIRLTETEHSINNISNPKNENIEILTDSNVDFENSNASEIEMEFKHIDSKSKENKKTNMFNNEGNSDVRTSEIHLKKEYIQSNNEINSVKLINEEKSNFSEESITLNSTNLVYENIFKVTENKNKPNCFINLEKLSERYGEFGNELSLEKIESVIIFENEGVKESEIDHVINGNPNEIHALLLPENNKVPQLETMINNSVIQYDFKDNSNMNNNFENGVNNFTQVLQEADMSSDISQNSDYIDDSPLPNFMEYVEECLNGNESKHGEIDSNSKIENWPNDEDSLNDIKRDFYEMNSMICSPHPSSESDHAHCFNNLTERVAILSAESILDNQCQMISSSDSEMTTTLNSPIFDDSNPELYVEKITYGGKELDVVYFEEALLEEGGVHPDIKIIRTIPVGLGGRIIGKKGKTKNELMKKYGAQLLIYNHPVENGKQVLEITCSPSVRNQLENWVNRTLDQITKNTLQTTVSNPEWLKPMIPLGKLVAAHIVDMPTIQHVKLRIFDPEIIKEFNKMQIEMNMDYNNVDNTALLPRPVAIGCVCVAMIRPDYFLRAQIVDIYEDIAWVYLFDLGKVCQTYLYYLFKIREKYMRVPFQIIPARIPNATIKNKNITPDIIFKRFLCNQSTLKPIMVRIFFPRMHTCCEPCVNVYVPVPTVSENENSEEFVDLLELLVSIDLCSMIKISVNSKIQTEINSSHVKAFLNEKVSLNLTVPMYFQPLNSKFYEDFVEFNSETENS